MGGLREMVVADQRLQASLEVVVDIGKLAQAAAANKNEGTGLRCEIFEVLLHVGIGRAESAKMHEEADLDGADDEMRRAMAEASISQSSKQLAKTESQLLTEM